MTETPCPDQTLFGAYVSSLLPRPEHEAIEQHVATCSLCSLEVARLSSVVRALMKADLSFDSVDPTVPDLSNRRIEMAIFDRIDGERRRHRYRGIAAAVAASVLVVSGVTAALTLRSDKPSGDGLYLAMAYPIGGKAEVKLQEKKWGTAIEVTTVDLPDGFSYGVWLERSDGTRVPAGSFQSTGSRKMSLMLSSALQVSEAAAIGMTERTSKQEVRFPLSSASKEQPK